MNESSEMLQQKVERQIPCPGSTLVTFLVSTLYMDTAREQGILLILEGKGTEHWGSWYSDDKISEVIPEMLLQCIRQMHMV